MLRGLIVTHGDLGRALKQTAETITGPVPELEVISNLELSRDLLCERIEVSLSSWDKAEGIVLTDIPGGSCTQATLLRAAARPEIGVVTGVNLSMLVDFLVNRGKFNAREMAERLESKGRTSIRNMERETRGSPSSRSQGKGLHTA